MAGYSCFKPKGAICVDQDQSPHRRRSRGLCPQAPSPPGGYIPFRRRCPRLRPGGLGVCRAPYHHPLVATLGRPAGLESSRRPGEHRSINRSPGWRGTGSSCLRFADQGRHTRGAKPIWRKRGWRLVVTGTLKETGLAVAMAAIIFICGLMLGGRSAILDTMSQYLG